MPPFEFIGTEISERRVQPVWIVEAFEVISDGVLGCPPRRPRLAVNELGLERRKKALSDGVDAPICQECGLGASGDLGECRS